MTVALILMILGWLIQLYYSASKKIFALSFKTVVLYAIGCILLFIDSLGRGSFSIAILSLATGAIAFVAGLAAKRAR